MVEKEEERRRRKEGRKLQRKRERRNENLKITKLQNAVRMKSEISKMELPNSRWLPLKIFRGLFELNLGND